MQRLKHSLLLPLPMGFIQSKYCTQWWCFMHNSSPITVSWEGLECQTLNHHVLVILIQPMRIFSSPYWKGRGVLILLDFYEKKSEELVGFLFQGQEENYKAVILGSRAEIYGIFKCCSYTASLQLQQLLSGKLFNH